ncbi:MAG: alpha/beta hydrolase [Actinobacteria bacterium]|nr:alpha/beta hydrolase [Actinomycetota bacterium]
MLLLHGGGQTRHSWGGTASVLAEHGFYAVNADLRGHGDSDWDPDGNYTLAMFQRDVEAWCRMLGRPAVVGASMGGLAALWTEGSRSRDGLEPAARAVVLVDIAHRSEPEGIQRIIDFMTGRPDGFASIDEAAEAVASYMPHRPRPSSNTGLARNLRLGDDGRYHWHWDPQFISGRAGPHDASDFEQLADHARRLTMPVLLVRGQMSDVVSEDAAHEFLHLVPHARFVDVGGASHMVAGDRNDVFTDAVVQFLGELG